VAWSLGGELDREILEDWLTRVESHVDSGQAASKTLPEIHDVHAERENRQQLRSMQQERWEVECRLN
jgi:hypothetical protein